MKSSRFWISAGLTLALAFAVLAPAGPFASAAWAKAASSAPGAAKKKISLRQFTGYVVAMEKSSFTVEKRGKKAQTRVFARPSDMKSAGELQKDSYVTVFYRDEDGHSIAHKVVVKEPGNS